MKCPLIMAVLSALISGSRVFAEEHIFDLLKQAQEQKTVIRYGSSKPEAAQKRADRKRRKVSKPHRHGAHGKVKYEQRVADNEKALEQISSVMKVVPYRGTSGAVTNDTELESLITHLEVADSLEVKKGATVHMGGNPVHGVGYGQVDDDAVNVRQLRDTAANLRREIGHVDKNASRGIASAMASAGLNQASLPGKYMISAGAADYRGQAALALGISTLSEDGRWSLKGTVNANEKNAGVTVSVGYQW